jgi:hypothetical protein
MMAMSFVEPALPEPVLSPTRHSGGRPARSRALPVVLATSHAVSCSRDAEDSAALGEDPAGLRVQELAERSCTFLRRSLRRVNQIHSFSSTRRRTSPTEDGQRMRRLKVCPDRCRPSCSGGSKIGEPRLEFSHGEQSLAIRLWTVTTRQTKQAADRRAPRKLSRVAATRGRPRLPQPLLQVRCQRGVRTRMRGSNRAIRVAISSAPEWPCVLTSSLGNGRTSFWRPATRGSQSRGRARRHARAADCRCSRRR